MKTDIFNNDIIVNMNSHVVLLDKQGQIPDLNIVQQVYDQETGLTTVVLSSMLFSTNPYKIFLRDNHLRIVVSEHIEFCRPVYIEQYNWHLNQKQSYDRFHSASILLPQTNYYLIDHHHINELGWIEIVLGNSLPN